VKIENKMVNMFSSIIAYKIKGRLNSESSWTKSSNDQRTIWNSSTELNPPAVWGLEETPRCAAAGQVAPTLTAVAKQN